MRKLNNKVAVITGGKSIAGVLSAVLVLTLSEVHADADVVVLEKLFPKNAQDAELCGGDFPQARAELLIEQDDGETNLELVVTQAPRLTFFTAWLRLVETNPLIGRKIAPLSNISDIAMLAQVTPDVALTQVAHDLGLVGDDGQGTAYTAVMVNGFFTNLEGEATFRMTLNYELIEGTYPLNELDASLVDISIPTESLSDPRIITIVSHCVDVKGHGLVPNTALAPVQVWFDLIQHPSVD